MFSLSNTIRTKCILLTSKLMKYVYGSPAGLFAQNKQTLSVQLHGAMFISVGLFDYRIVRRFTQRKAGWVNVALVLSEE